MTRRSETPVHIFPLRVYYEDTDAAGIVYYANYLKFTERARTELLRELGTEQGRLMDTQGVGFAVRRCEVDYLSPARLDDALEVRTSLLDAKGARMDALQTVTRPRVDGFDELARVRIRVACIDRQGRPVRLPRDLCARLADWVAA